jgi:N-acetylglutamate synthase-like GNAT family acetyltransferase
MVVSPHLSPKGAGAEMILAAKDFAKMLGIRKAGCCRNGFQNMVGFDQSARDLLQPDLRDELGRRQAGHGAEMVAEMAAAHAARLGQIRDIGRIA